ncbi:unnamed protein product [Ambrosiozyma monospora]|uniref:Unnamed protein product n=1 Tax=Ambrosiozyma monospora TaxID=43982 RepID=A0ACB5UE52_AMBMO|nr:unnamed protein product [Ambrosiozyma monospora]
MPAFQYYLALIEQNMKVNYFIQIMIILFLFNLIVVDFMKMPMNPVDGKPDDTNYKNMVATGFVLISVVAAFAIALNGTWKVYVKNLKANPDEKVDYGLPQLPDFELIYGTVIPLVLVLLKSPKLLPIVAAGVSQLPNMADIVKVIVSFVVEAQTITEETIMGIREIVAVPLLYFGLHYMLNKYTFDSFTQTERNLMTILFMTMVFAIRASSSNITLVILQKLVYSFGMGAVFNVPLMEFYVKQQQNSTKYVLAAENILLSSWSSSSLQLMKDSPFSSIGLEPLSL